jgi:restriction endonuclease Mrr
VSSTNVKSSDWFQFEKDVRDVMISLGYDVEHISASKRGDKGVDLYATKLIGDTEEQWIIQCKCWSQNHKIGPSVVREFLGALKPYPSGTRGMIVTTSLFTSEALTLAEETGITLMDGTDFSHCLKTLKNESE